MKQLLILFLFASLGANAQKKITIRASSVGSGVTSVATNNATGITGGPITTTGTLAIDTNLLKTHASHKKAIDSLGALISEPNLIVQPLGTGVASITPISDTLYHRTFDSTYALTWDTTTTRSIKATIDTARMATRAWVVGQGYGSMTNPMTTQGDLIYGGASGTATRLPGAATDNHVLKYDLDTNTPFWAAESGGGGGTPAGSTGQVQFNSAGVFGADADFHWDNTNKRLGLNTAAPIGMLHLSGDGSTPAAAITPGGAQAYLSSTSVPALAFITASNTNTHRGVFSSARANGTPAAPTIAASNVQAFQILSNLYDGTDLEGTASIEFWADGSAAANSMPQRISFWTSSSSTANRLERMRLTNTGSVLIGTTSEASSAILNVQSTSKGFLPPKMTGAQAEAITSPAEGLMIYATDGTGTTITSKGWWGYDGTTWVKMN